MIELEVTWGRAARIYWAFIWRGFLYMIPLFFFFIIVGIIMRIGGHTPLEGNRLITQVFAMLCGIPIGIYIVKQVLLEQMSNFRIALISVDTVGSAQPGAPEGRSAGEPTTHP